MVLEMVGVVGLGTMGAGIAEVFARAGIRVCGVEADEVALARGRAHLERSTGRALDKGKLTAAEREEILARVTLTTSRADLRDADLVIEAIPERMDLKVELFGELDRICKPSTILATNTSSLSVTALAAATGRPGRLVGMHFFNPAPVMGLVEVVGTVVTDPGVVDEVAGLAVRLGKSPVTVGDGAGFVVNRLLLPYLNHAVTLLDHGVAARDDIDHAMKLGVGLPMGPFQLLDLIGLDTAYEIMNVLFDESRSDRHVPSPLLRSYVAAGLLGRKSGRGFYGEAGDGPQDKAPARTVRVVGSPELADRLDTAGFKESDDPDVVLQVGGSLPLSGNTVRVRLSGQVAELAVSVLTTQEAALGAHGLLKIAGYTPVPCKDRAGLVIEALLFSHLNDAVRMYESGYAAIDDIDAAMRLGCGYVTGPFELIESIGLATVRDGLRALHAERLTPSSAPAPLLDQLVTAGLTRFPRP
ncbi:3-hydroxyacyl-CoA dehydrogenase [Nonomuraea sp. NPDC059194]|uniref:3-hydroxyacyl-CoA dehydrogenase n=1 Tax=Nonomuraea sp. NPDC059194 TaxID=3346764 RepID=UPI0036876EEB